MTATKKAVAAAGSALEAFARRGPYLTLREAVEHLAPSLAVLEGRGESWSTIADVCRRSGLDIRPAMLRRYYKDFLRESAKRGTAE